MMSRWRSTQRRRVFGRAANSSHSCVLWHNTKSRAARHGGSNMTQLVSVIVPVRNGAEYILEALASVANQPWQPLELIVVDDGSTDRTAETVHTFASSADLPVRYVYQTNAGPASARNHGLCLAEGELIAFQDADDIWTAGRLALQAALLRQYPAADFVLGKTRIFGADPGLVAAAGGGPDSEPRWFLGVQCGLYRRHVFDKVGGFDARLRYNEDIDWFRRASALDIANIAVPEVVLLHRRHPGNMTNDRGAVRTDLLRMLRSPTVNHSLLGESLLAALTRHTVAAHAVRLT